MGASFRDVLSYFEKEHKGYFEVGEEQQIVRETIKGDNSSYKVAVAWNDEASRINFWVRDIMAIPQPKRATAGTLVNMINWRLDLSDFEFDMEDGELMVNLSFNLRDGTLGHDQIDSHFNAVVWIADKYYPAFQKVVWADVSPEEALASVNR